MSIFNGLGILESERVNLDFFSSGIQARTSELKFTTKNYINYKILLFYLWNYIIKMVKFEYVRLPFVNQEAQNLSLENP